MSTARLSHEGRAFIEDFAALSQFGTTPYGGVERQAGTQADGEQRQWLAQWMTDRGFKVRYDKVGNQYGLLEFVPGAPYVLSGSHLDSQPFAGRFDGAFGVLASAHAIDRLRREWSSAAITPMVNVGVVNWFNEEGSRFKPSMMGSSVYTGKLDLETALDTRDGAGILVRDAIAKMGSLGDEDGPTSHAYAEIHIEQGRILENASIPIGVVNATWATEKFDLVVHGEQSHTGSTVMADRRDALLGAALLIVGARDLADEFSSPTLHTSVSELSVEPNSPVVVAREVRLHVDFRSADKTVLRMAVERFGQIRTETEKRARVTIEQVGSHRWDVLDYPEAGVTLAEKCAAELGLRHQRIMTIAGHDSTNMKDIVPTVMLFVPSKDGVSHNIAEYTNDEDCCAGVDLLTKVIRELCLGDTGL